MGLSVVFCSSRRGGGNGNWRPPGCPLVACFDPGCEAREPRALYDRAGAPGKRKDLRRDGAPGLGCDVWLPQGKVANGRGGDAAMDAAFQSLQKVYLSQSGGIFRNHEF